MNSISQLKRVIVCSPVVEYFRAPELARHNLTTKSDPETARLQHSRFKKVLAGSGFEVVDVPEMKDHPNSVFTRDASLVTPGGYVMLRMGLESRRGEEEWMAGELESIGITMAGSITGNGTVEGGDVILGRDVAFVGNSGRTNREGVAQISSILQKMNFEVRTVQVPGPFLHLGGAMSLLPSSHILCCRGIFPEAFFDGFTVIEVPRENFVTGNVISLPNDEIIAEKANAPAAGILRQNGFRVRSLDLSEFVKGTGGPSCLIMPA